MSRLLALAGIAFFLEPHASALAQMPVTPGPGGIPIAPGAPVPGYTPGGVGPGGVEIAPGSAARSIPMYRTSPGGTPLPPALDPYPDRRSPTAKVQPGCGNGSPCLPDVLPRTLSLTINSRDAAPDKAPSQDAPIESIHDLFAVLRTCWEPPAQEQAQAGVQMSVRFSFKRTGEIIAPPFVTYTTPGTKADTKQTYRRAINASLERCAPLRFSKTFSGAIAGQPISVRYVDDRVFGTTSQRP
jgi:hypothetical protein